MAYDKTVQYVDRDDYFKFSGIDLNIEMKKGNYDNETRAVDIFIKRIENWLYNYLWTNYDTETFDETAFKDAVMHQIDYVRFNGDLAIDAANRLQVLAQPAKDVLKQALMLNPSRDVKYYGYRY